MVMIASISSNHLHPAIPLALLKLPTIAPESNPLIAPATVRAVKNIQNRLPLFQSEKDYDAL